MPLISNPQDITLTEEDDVQQILGHTPGWMLQWGSSLIALGFVFIIFIAWYVRYPDIVPAQITLTTEQPPIPVVARTNGKISELSIVEKQQVEKGVVLAVIENTVNTQDILYLEALFYQIERLDAPMAILDIDLPSSLQLGELQRFYAAFNLQFDDFNYFLRQHQVVQSIRILKNQIKEINNLNVRLEAQKNTLKEVYDLAIENATRQDNLQKDGSVSKQKEEAARMQMLTAKRTLELSDNEIITNRLQIEKIKGEILKLEQSNDNSYSTKWLKLLENIQTIKGEIAKWKEKYLLTAPISGQVTMPTIQNENQFVKAQDQVMYVTPTNNSGRIFGKADLPIPRAGKVELGQDVKVRLWDYPYQEYGVVEGSVKDIALVPTTDQNGNASYYVEIDLPEGLVTTYKDSTLTFRQGMQGVAQIVTKEQSILGNLFNKIWNQIWN